MCVFVVLFKSVGRLCVQWTLSDLGFDSPNIAKGICWIHVHVSACVNACVNACVAACKVIHWLRQTKYDIEPHILSAAVFLHTQIPVGTKYFNGAAWGQVEVKDYAQKRFISLRFWAQIWSKPCLKIIAWKSIHSACQHPESTPQ